MMGMGEEPTYVTVCRAVENVACGKQNIPKRTHSCDYYTRLYYFAPVLNLDL